MNLCKRKTTKTRNSIIINTVDLHWDVSSTLLSSPSSTSNKLRSSKKKKGRRRRRRLRANFHKSVTARKWHIEWNHTDPSSLCTLERNPKITQPDKFLTLWNKKTFVTPLPTNSSTSWIQWWNACFFVSPLKSLTFHFCVAAMRRTVQNQTQLTRTGEEDDVSPFLLLLLYSPYPYYISSF